MPGFEFRWKFSVFQDSAFNKLGNIYKIWKLDFIRLLSRRFWYSERKVFLMLLLKKRVLFCCCFIAEGKFQWSKSLPEIRIWPNFSGLTVFMGKNIVGGEPAININLVPAVSTPHILTCWENSNYQSVSRKQKRKGVQWIAWGREDWIKNINNRCLIPPLLPIIHAPCREKAFNTMKRQKKTKYCKDLHRNGMLPILVASCSNTWFSALRWM